MTAPADPTKEAVIVRWTLHDNRRRTVEDHQFRIPADQFVGDSDNDEMFTDTVCAAIVEILEGRFDYVITNEQEIRRWIANR